MGKGYGPVQRAVLEAVTASGWRAMPVPDIASAVFPKGATASNLASMRRALANLRQDGWIVKVGRDWITKEVQGKKDRQKERHQKNRERSHREQESWSRYFHSKRKAEPKADTDLLVKFLGMLGSDQDGERLNAARLVERERKRLGLSWAELIPGKRG